MKKIYLISLIALLLTAVSLMNVGFKQPEKSKAKFEGSYYFAYASEQQRPEGCCAIVISNAFKVDCDKNPAYIRIDIMAPFKNYYKANFARQSSYITPSVSGPFNSYDEANAERDRVISEAKMRDNSLSVLNIHGFGYSCN